MVTLWHELLIMTRSNMHKLESLVQSLIKQTAEQSFKKAANLTLHSNVISCPNGIEIKIDKPAMCGCCKKPVEVFNVRDVHYPVDKKNTVMHRATYCRHTDSYSQDIYIIFSYLLGAKLHYLKRNNELSFPIATFSLPIGKALKISLIKLVDTLKSKFVSNH